MKINIGRRASRKECFTEVFTVIGHVFGIFATADVIRGIISKISVRMNEELNSSI